MENPYAKSPETFEVVFGGIVAFSTSLSAHDLADETVPRRVDRKCAMDCARPADCVEISRRQSVRHGLAFRVAAICRYEGRTPGLEAALSCRAYHGYLIEF